MTMAHVDELTLNEYLDNELPLSKRVDVEAHLTECTSCQAELAELQQLFFTLDSAAEAPFAVDISAAVAYQIEQEQSINRNWFSVNSSMLLAFELLAATVLLFLLWPTLQEWLLQANDWQFQLAVNVTWLEPVSWAEIMARITAVLTNSQAIFYSFQSAPLVDLATMQWAVLIGIALIIWLAGNRLLFTNDSR